jgi:iron complex outermembrane receptor protein
MFKKLGLWIPILFTICSTGQNTGIRGLVMDADDRMPLISAHVHIPELELGVVTDENGQFELACSPGSYELIVRFIGYGDFRQNIQVVDEWTELQILMEVSSIGLGSVVVTASKFEQRMEEVTVSIEVLQPELIENKNSRYVDQAINQSPGISVIDDQASIRGGSGWSMGAGTRVTTLVDGIPLVSGDAGQVQWQMVPSENIHQMEIIKGASSALYGSSAMNGVINIRTSFPSTEPETKISLFQGFYGDPAREENKWSNLFGDQPDAHQAARRLGFDGWNIRNQG